MAASDHPAPSAAPEQSPAAMFAPAVSGPGASEIIPVPVPTPREPAPSPEQPSRVFGIVLTSLVLLFAFLVTSSAIRNSDFWLHLATGRLVAHGEYRFGADHFNYTSADAYFVNHAWLFDLGIYALYQASGGLGLVILKAIALIFLAALLMRIRNPGTGAALPAACTLLAFLAMSPRLLWLQPACASFLLLGIAFYLLWRPHVAGEEPPSAKDLGGHLRRYGPLLVVFALWANLDDWFFLGPVLAALFWIGERLGSSGRRPTPWWLIPAGFAVCLLNPHFHRVFMLPPELAPDVWASALREDARFRSWFLSPWYLSSYLDSSPGLGVGGLAYFMLVALGLTSFFLRRRDLVGWRLLIWGAFAAVAAWQSRAIPFFALVAGPITALNLQDVAAAREARAAQPSSRRLLFRIADATLLLAAVALAVLIWPGWLQAVSVTWPGGFQFARDRHRVAWEIQADPSLQRVAEALHTWRQEGFLGKDEHIFPLRPEVIHYCAWFAPGEKGFLDYHSPRISRLGTQYEAVCRGLAGRQPESEDDERWQDVLRDNGVSVVVLYDPNEQRLFPALQQLASATSDWDLLRIDGKALVFGWKRGRPSGSFGDRSLDSHRQAFGLGNDNSILGAAPGLGPQRAPERQEWWADFLYTAPAPRWESDAATMYLRYFEDRAPAAQLHAVAGYAAALVGIGAPGTPRGSEQVAIRLVEFPPFFVGFATRQPDLPLLAVRAARRALAANPDDANAWFRLGQAYFMLHRETIERAGPSQAPLLSLLRHVQAATALEHALLIDPDLELAHEALSVLYMERRFLDAAVEHRMHALRLTRRAPRLGEPREDFDARVTDEEDAVQQLERLVQGYKNDFAIRSRAMVGDPLGRAQLALSMGLAKLAVDDVLLQSPVQAFAGEGARLELELLLQLGRAESSPQRKQYGVREILDDPEIRESKRILELSRVPAPDRPGYLRLYRLGAYEWLRFLQTAATGDYDLADEALEELIRPMVENARGAMEQLRVAIPEAVAFELALSSDPQLLLPRLIMENERRQFVQILTEVSFLSAEQADLYVLGGLLAAERGSPAAALRAFDAAIAAADQRTPRGDFASAMLADIYRRQLQAFAGETKKR